MLKPLSLLAVMAAVAAAPVPAAPDGNTVTIRVTNVRSAKGRLHVDLCPQATFLKDGCPISAAAPAQTPVTTVIVRNVPPGHYAAQLFHDENANDRMDRGLFGIPKEGVAFSHDALRAMAPPKWTDAAFAYPGGAQALQVKMRYYLGPAGPQGR